MLLIFDEIQCGMARTGKLFAFEYADVQPDICTSARGIAGGFPLGACLATHKAASGMVYGTHGSTYGGNPLGCAVGAKAVQMMLAKGFMENIQDVGFYLNDLLKKLSTKFPKVITEIRGKGLMQGFVLSSEFVARDVVAKMLEAGIITIPASENVVRILPPLIITKHDCDDLITLLETFFETLEKEQKTSLYYRKIFDRFWQKLMPKISVYSRRCKAQNML